MRRPDLRARDGTVAIDGVSCGPGESAAQLAEFIAKAHALSAKYQAERVRYKARAEVVPVTREMLGCAVCGQLAGLASLVWSVREETYQRVLTLCMAEFPRPCSQADHQFITLRDRLACFTQKR
jgi:hypothetical protein